MDPQTTDEPKAPDMPKAPDVLTKAALERLKRATDNRDPNGYTAVNAGDVLAVGASLKGDKKTGVVDALMKGATGAGPNAEVFQRTEHLLHMLEQAG